MATIIFKSTRRQHGYVLFISLIILLIMTIIGVTAMSLSSLEEKMAGNAYDRQLAMHAAEAALRAGEDMVRSFSCNTNVLTQDCSNGWCSSPQSQTVPGWERSPSSTVWQHAVQYEVAMPHVSARPKFVVEDLCEKDAKDSPPKTKDARVFRVTALGVGASAAAQVILQSTFEVPNPYPTGGPANNTGGDCAGTQYVTSVTHNC